jgi:hypothetical protein
MPTKLTQLKSSSLGALLLIGLLNGLEFYLLVKRHLAKKLKI